MTSSIASHTVNQPSMTLTRVLTACFILAVTLTSGAEAARVEALGNTVTGSTITVEGNLATFPDAASNKYSATMSTLTDSFATVDPLATSSDFYFNFGAAALGTIDVATHQYVEVFYTMPTGFSGAKTTNQLRLNTSNQNAGFVSFLNRGLIGQTAGTHSMILDLQNSTDLDPGTAGDQYSGNLTSFRWDFFNETGNGGNTFTLDKLVFGTSVTAVPEPSSIAILAVSGLVVCGRRRR